MKKISIFILLFFPIFLFSQDIKVQLLPKLNCNSLKFIAEKGAYVVFSKGIIVADILEGNNANIRYDNAKDSIELIIQGELIGYFGQVKIISPDTFANFSFESFGYNYSRV